MFAKTGAAVEIGAMGERFLKWILGLGKESDKVGVKQQQVVVGDSTSTTVISHGTMYVGVPIPATPAPANIDAATTSTLSLAPPPVSDIDGEVLPDGSGDPIGDIIARTKAQLIMQGDEGETETSSKGELPSI